MRILSDELPITAGGRKSYIATIIGNEQVCREHFWLKLHVPDFPKSAPGQFVQLQGGTVAGDEDLSAWDWSPGQVIDGSHLLKGEALLNRPFSIAACDDGSSDGPRPQLVIIYRVIGAATEWLSRQSIHSTLQLIGPLGNPFRPPPEDFVALLIGGGVGIPPMLYCAQQFQSCQRIAFCGVMTKDLLPLTVLTRPDERGLEPRPYALGHFAANNTPAIITSDDGSIGRRGFVTDALRDWLDSHREVRAKIYACGPEPMLKRVAEIACEFSVRCEIAVERAMACGLGTCQSCVIRVREEDGWKYKLACTDGPVFDATQLLW